MPLITSRFRRFRDWYRGSLANAFAASSALIAVTSSLVVALISLVVIHYVESRALQSDLEARSVRVADALVSTLKVVDDATDALATSSIFMTALLDSNGRTAYVTPFIEDYRFPIDANSAMALCDINGNVLASTRNHPVRCDRQSPAFQRALQSPLPQREVIRSQDGRSIRRLLVGVVFSYTGSVEGVVVAEVELASLMQHIAKEASVWSMELKPANSPTDGVRIQPPADSGDITHVVQRRIIDGEGSGASIDLELRVGDRLSVWQGKLIPLLMSYGAVVLILVFLVVRLTRRAALSTVSPLRELILTAARIAETRDLTMPIPHAEAGEVSQLGRALESMVTELRAAELQLEAKVLERTEQLRASESALRDHSAQLDAVFNLSPDGFVSFDPSHHVASVNQAFLTMTGWDAAEAKGLSAPQFVQRLARQCVSDNALASIEAMLSDPDGKPLPLELAPPMGRMLLIRTRQATSENVSQIWYFRDITHEAEVDRMKSEFLQVAAHELRTPMTSVYGFSELLLTRDMSEAQRRDLLGRIVSQSKRVVSIVNELLDLARIEARRGKDFVIGRVDVDQSIAQLIGEFSAPPGRDAPRVIGDAGGAFIKADRGKFDQVFINVLSNAFKYSPNGGDVDIAFRHEGTAQQALLGIEVRDHGMGMSPAQLKHVCERFFRADTTGAIPGTGLGMSIVKELIELHGGRLDITSELGVGTTVTLWWPKA